MIISSIESDRTIGSNRRWVAGASLGFSKVAWRFELRMDPLWRPLLRKARLDSALWMGVERQMGAERQMDPLLRVARRFRKTRCTKRRRRIWLKGKFKRTAIAEDFESFDPLLDLRLQPFQEFGSWSDKSSYISVVLILEIEIWNI